MYHSNNIHIVVVDSELRDMLLHLFKDWNSDFSFHWMMKNISCFNVSEKPNV